MKKSILSFFCIVILLSFLVRIPSVEASPAWLSGWGKRIKIEIDCGDIDSDLSSFPILIFLSNSSAGQYDEDVSFIFDEIGANSKKIALTVGETAETYVEIEEWDSTNEQAWLWANVTATSASNQTLYLYYDNNHADNTNYVGDTDSTSAENVWDSDFVAVYHLKDITTSTIADSTCNDNDGTKNYANQPIEITGFIGKAQDFDGSNDGIDVADADSLDIGTQDYSMEMWIKTSDVSKQEICKKQRYTYGTYYMETWATGKAVIGMFAEPMEYAETATTVIDGNWQYLFGTYDHTILTIYVNGTSDGTDPCTKNVGLNNYILSIGIAETDAIPFDGLIDELRISKICRSSVWVKASYETQINHLLDWGIEEIILVYITFYNTAGGIVRVNNVTITNATEYSFLNETTIELLAVILNSTYSFLNFTWDTGYNGTNPHNLTILGNLTLWCYFRDISPTFPATLAYPILAIAIIAICAAVIFTRRSKT